MTEFKASSGLTVEVSGAGNIRLYSVDGHNRLQECDYLNDLDMQALREFFNQERKEELPFRHGDCWVFPIGDSPITGIRRVVVVGRNTYTTLIEGETNSPLAAAAQAWFAAHPKAEPKPWLDAQSGEVWEISDGVNGGLAICQREPDQDSDDNHPYFYGPNFDGIRGDELTAATKLEVQS